MANTLVHLVVAKQILDSNPNLVTNKTVYYFSSIAPDTIGSKPNSNHEDKKFAHLRAGISDLDWLKPDQFKIFENNIDSFIAKHIKSEDIDNDQLSFNIGYLVHLLTDKWNHITVRQTMLKVANSMEYRKLTVSSMR